MVGVGGYTYQDSGSGLSLLLPKRKGRAGERSRFGKGLARLRVCCWSVEVSGKRSSVMMRKWASGYLSWSFLIRGAIAMQKLSEPAAQP